MISLVIATYNGSKFLREQLDSIYNQTMLPDEIIVVDDCSKDNTIDILQEYKNKYNLKYYRNDSNLGVNKTFEKAIALSSGDYIAICDQDDVWLPQKIEILYKKIKEIEYDNPACVSSQRINVDSHLKKIKTKILKNDSWGSEATLIHDGVSQGCTMMMNRRLVEMMKPFPDDSFLYDAYIGMVAASIGVKYNLSNQLMLYRHHESNVIAQIRKPNSLYCKFINYISWRRNCILFPEIRFKHLFIIRNEYKSLLKDDAIIVLDKIDEYCNARLFSKIGIIFSFKTYSVLDKFKLSIILIIISVFYNKYK